MRPDLRWQEASLLEQINNKQKYSMSSNQHNDTTEEFLYTFLYKSVSFHVLFVCCFEFFCVPCLMAGLCLTGAVTDWTRNSNTPR